MKPIILEGPWKAKTISFQRITLVFVGNESFYYFFFLEKSAKSGLIIRT